MPDLKRSVKTVLNTTSPPVNAFSGGLDSSLPAAVAEEVLEEILPAIGFSELCLCPHDDVAGISVPEDESGDQIASRETIPDDFRHPGFIYNILDIIGYRGGSMIEES
ncbi:hypothetical protein RJ53_04390 [Methanocalculus chunghsingensis]|uniref:Uncharacterized protein n=1 Tax=Methanocalculus chunghsingensis TaxID=156457 RepID=A0A8J8B6L5_9EURY|nr:hypothetical protein [Methanocalculus chunghsingensis]MBR1368787.1 hypothetical protein [Methanocalculus chunghsingensis]